MGDLMAALVPEILGLAVTPAAVISCLLLLGSTHPLRNVATLAGVFLVSYGLLSVVVLSVGRAADPGAHATSVRGWLSLLVGAVFLVVGLLLWSRGRAAPTAGAEPGAATYVQEPAWVRSLTDPSVGLVVRVGLLLAVVNPNVAILVSGLGVVLTAEVTPSQEVLGVVVLLGASLLDFILPTLAFLISGPRGRARLREGTHWLMVHNQVIGIVVLVAFGALFVGRGLAQLVG